MTARSCSGMQRSPPLVLGLFILTLLLLMGCGSGTSTGAPGPPHKVQDPSRMPRRLRRKVELSSAPQLRLDAVSTEERVPHTDSSLRMDLENAGSLLPPSQLQSPTPASEKREERRVDVSLPPPPRSDQNELEEALWSNKLMHRNQIREFQRISDDVHSAIQPRHYAQSSDQDTAGSMGSISVSVFPAPESEVESASLTRRQRSPQTNEDPPRPRQSLPSRNRRWRASGSGEVHLSVAPERERRASGPQLQTDHDPPPAAPAASAPPAPSAPSALPPPSLQLQTAPPQPPAAPQQQRISTRGPSAIQMLARPVATIAAAAVPARSLLPPGQQLPQQPPVLLIFPQRQETTKAPEVTGTPSSAHLTGQAPQQGNGMGGSANMAPPHSSTMTPDEVASTCILALQNALRHVKSQLKPGQQVGQSQQQSQLQTPGQTPNQTQAQGSEAKEQSQEKSQQMAQQITSAQKSQEIGSQHNAEAPLMLTLSRGALSPASGIQSSPASPNTNILLQIELPMGTPSIDGTSQPRPPQIMLAPTPTHLTTHAQEAWMKESLVESKSGLRASFPHLDQRREHDEQRLRRQTVADVGPQNELDADSSASDADDFSSADTIPRSFPRGLVSTPVEGEEHPLRRSMLYPEQLDVRKDTIMTLNAQEPVVHRRRDTGKRRLKKKVLSWNEGTANVELRFIPRAKRPRHRIEVPDTFLPLASELARLGTTSQLTSCRVPMHASKRATFEVSKSTSPSNYGIHGTGASRSNLKLISSLDVDSKRISPKSEEDTKESHVSEFPVSSSNPVTSYLSTDQTSCGTKTNQGFANDVIEIPIILNFSTTRTTKEINDYLFTLGFTTPINEITSKTTGITVEIHRKFTAPISENINYESSKTTGRSSASEVTRMGFASSESTPITIQVITVSARKLISPMTVNSPRAIPEPTNDESMSEPETLLKTVEEYFDYDGLEDMGTRKRFSTRSYLPSDSKKELNLTSRLQNSETPPVMSKYLMNDGIASTPSVLNTRSASTGDKFSPTKIFPTSIFPPSKEDLMTEEKSPVFSLGGRIWTIEAARTNDGDLRLQTEGTESSSTKRDKEWPEIPLDAIPGNTYGEEFIEKKKLVSDRRWHTSLRDFNWDKFVQDAGRAVGENPVDSHVSDLQHKGRMKSLPPRVSTSIPRTRTSNGSSNARPLGEDIDENEPSDNLANRLDTVALKTVMKMEEEERKDYDSAEDEAEWVPLPVLNTASSVVAGNHAYGSQSFSANTEDAQPQPRIDVLSIKREGTPQKRFINLLPNTYTVSTEKSAMVTLETFSTNNVSTILTDLKTNSNHLLAFDENQPTQETSSVLSDLLYQLGASLPNPIEDMAEDNVYPGITPVQADSRVDTDTTNFMTSSESTFFEPLHRVPLLRDNTFVNLIPNASLLFQTPKQNTSEETLLESDLTNELFDKMGIPREGPKEIPLGDLSIQILGLLPMHNLTYSPPTEKFTSPLSFNSTSMESYTPTTVIATTATPQKESTRGDINVCGCRCSQGNTAAPNVKSSITMLTLLESSKSTLSLPSTSARTSNNSKISKANAVYAPRYADNISSKETQGASITKSYSKSKYHKKRHTSVKSTLNGDSNSFLRTKKFLHRFKSAHSSPINRVSLPLTTSIPFDLNVNFNQSQPIDRSLPVLLISNQSAWKSNPYLPPRVTHPDELETKRRGFALFQHHSENGRRFFATKSYQLNEMTVSQNTFTASSIRDKWCRNTSKMTNKNTPTKIGAPSTKSRHWQFFRHHSPIQPFSATDKLRFPVFPSTLATRINSSLTMLRVTPELHVGESTRHSKGLHFPKKIARRKQRRRGGAHSSTVAGSDARLKLSTAFASLATVPTLRPTILTTQPAIPSYSNVTLLPSLALASVASATLLGASTTAETASSPSNIIFISSALENTSFLDAVNFLSLKESSENNAMETTSPLMFPTKAFPNIVFNERNEDESQLYSNKEMLSGNIVAGHIIPPSWSTSPVPGIAAWKALAQEAEELATLALRTQLGQASSAANTGESPLSPFEHAFPIPVPVVTAWGSAVDPLLHGEDYGSKANVAPPQADNSLNSGGFNDAYIAHAKQDLNDTGNSNSLPGVSTLAERNPPFPFLNIDELINSFKSTSYQPSSITHNEKSTYENNTNNISFAHVDPLLSKKPSQVPDAKNSFEYHKKYGLLNEPVKSTQPSIVSPVRKLLFNEETLPNNENLYGGRVKLGEMCDPVQDYSCVCVLGEALTFLDEVAAMDPGGWWRSMKSIPCPIWRKLPFVLEADRSQYSDFFVSSLYGEKLNFFGDEPFFTRYAKPLRRTWARMHQGLERVAIPDDDPASYKLHDTAQRTWALQGANVNLPCPVAVNASSRGAKAPEFVWWRGKSMIYRRRFNASAAPAASRTSGTNNSLASVGMGTLLLEHVSATDAGNYRCDVLWDSSAGLAEQLTGNHHLEVIQVPHVVFRAEVRYSVDPDISRQRRQDDDDQRESDKQKENLEDREEEENEEDLIGNASPTDETTREEEPEESSTANGDTYSNDREGDEDGARSEDETGDQKKSYIQFSKVNQIEDSEEEEERGRKQFASFAGKRKPTSGRRYREKKKGSSVKEEESESEDETSDEGDREKEKGSSFKEEESKPEEETGDDESTNDEAKVTTSSVKEAWDLYHKQLGWIRKQNDATVVHKHIGPLLVEVKRSTFQGAHGLTEKVTDELEDEVTNEVTGTYTDQETGEVAGEEPEGAEDAPEEVTEGVTGEVTDEVTDRETELNTVKSTTLRRVSNSKGCTREIVELLVDLAGPLLGEAACGPKGVCRTHVTRACCLKRVAPSDYNVMSGDNKGKMKPGAHRLVGAGYSDIEEECYVRPRDRRFEASPNFHSPFSAVIRIERETGRSGLLKATAEFRLSPLERYLSALNTSTCGPECHLRAQQLFAELVNEHNVQAALSIPLILKGLDQRVRLVPVDFPSPQLQLRCSSGYYLHYEVCLPCPPESFSEDDSEDCSECPMGTHQPRSGSKECVVCSNPFVALRCLSLVYRHFGWFLLSMAVLVLLVSALVYCCSAFVLRAKDRRRRAGGREKREKGERRERRDRRDRRQKSCTNTCVRPTQKCIVPRLFCRKKQRCAPVWTRASTPQRCVEVRKKPCCAPEQNFQVLDLVVGRQESLEAMSESTDVVVDSEGEEEVEEEENCEISEEEVADEEMVDAEKMMGVGESSMEEDEELEENGDGSAERVSRRRPTPTDLRRWSGRSSERQPLLPRIDEIDEDPCCDPKAWRHRSEMTCTPTFSATSSSSRRDSTRTGSARSYGSFEEEEEREKKEKPNIPSPDFSLLSDDVPRNIQPYIRY